MSLKNFLRPVFWSLSNSSKVKGSSLNVSITRSFSICQNLVSSTQSWWSRPESSALHVASRENHTRRHFHKCTPCERRAKDQLSFGDMLASMPKQDDGTEGEKIADIDSSFLKQQSGIFPDVDTPNRLFDGIRFADLPICNIKATPNNTIMSLTNALGRPLIIHSCGMEGFKNTREGTNVAAQATAITLATKGLAQGFKNVRVSVRGLGPGRMSAIKGLTMAGMNVVSVTDRTPITWCSSNPRPKKRRKL